MQVEDDGGRESAYPENVRLDFPLIGHARAAHGEAFSSDVLHAIGDLPHDALVCFVSGAVSCVSSQGLWDAVKMFELHDTVTGVGGRVLDRSGVVVDGGGVFVDQGAIVDPFAGRAASDPGPYALALKSHRIDRPCDALFILRLGALQTALHSRRVDDSATLVSVIAAQQLASGSATAYVPLLEGTAQRWRASGGPRKSNAGVVRRMAAAAGHSGLLPNRHGLAALSRYYRRRRLS
jgi:hypothetical protein